MDLRYQTALGVYYLVGLTFFGWIRLYFVSVSSRYEFPRWFDLITYAWHSGTTATCVSEAPWPSRVLFAYPALIFADRAIPRVHFRFHLAYSSGEV